MSLPKIYKTEAIVLKKVEVGEADNILTLYTPYLGKIKALARGVRRPESKLGGHLELLTHSELMIVQSQGLDIITQAQTIESFLKLREDLWRTSCALYTAELVDQFAPEGEENYPVFKLLVEVLGWLCQAKDGDLVLRYFELHLLEHLGYRPQLEQCLSCHSHLKPVINFFTPSGGGVLCPYCRSKEPDALPLSPDILKGLDFIQHHSYAQVSRLRISPQLSLKLEQLMRGYISYLLEREVKSASWLDKLRRR